MAKDMINNMSGSYSIFRKRGKANNNAFSMFPFIESPQIIKIKMYC